MASPASPRYGPLTVQLHADGEALTVGATGELDIATTNVLQKALRHAFDGDTASIIRCRRGDLHRLGGPASSALGRTEPQDDHRLSVRRGSGAVRRMIEMTRIDRSLRLIP